MPDLGKLEEAHRDAKKAYRKSGSDANRAAFERARDAFVSARVEQRRSEELDPDHPRGQGLAAVSED